MRILSLGFSFPPLSIRLASSSLAIAAAVAPPMLVFLVIPVFVVRVADATALICANVLLAAACRPWLWW